MWFGLMKMDKYKPAVSKGVLLFLSGMFWFCIGTMLLLRAASWLQDVSNLHRCVCGILGTILALLVYRFGFRRIADKNRDRIFSIDDKRCVFAFMPWESYCIIPVMIAMGVMLRHSPFSKQYIAILYVGMGLALIFASFRYAKFFLREQREC